MDKLAAMSNAERHGIFQEVANRRGLTTVIIEKDFWVCWMLKRLFLHTGLAEHLTFKGGTSLSKAYHLIERFSEDIDLTISRRAPHLVDVKDPMEEEISNKERGRRIDDLKEKAQIFIREEVRPMLEKDIGQVLRSGAEWRVIMDEDDPDKQTVLFYYPGVDFGKSQPGYIQSRIKLEFGARGDTEPSSIQTITSFVAVDFPELFTVKDCTIPTLSAERSFWEKATILHAIHHGAKIRDHMSRHYYDVYMMDQKGITKKALADTGLLDQVVANKQVMFRDAKASYNTARIGSLKMVPEGEAFDAVKKDYAAMDEMFMGKPPSFTEIMAKLAILEKRINGHE